MDSENVVTTIDGGVCSNDSCLSLIKEIKQQMEGHEFVQVVHTFRETNLCVDTFATMRCFNKSSQNFRDLLINSADFCILTKLILISR